MAKYKYHSIEIPLRFLPDRPTLAGYVRTLNAAGCVAFCNPRSHTLSIDIPDSKWKHEEHIVEEEDI